MHFTNGLRKLYRRVSLNTAQKERGALYRAHVSHISIASHRLEIVFRLGHLEAWVRAWSVLRLMGGGSGLTSPLGSVLSQCTARYRSSFAVQGIYAG